MHVLSATPGNPVTRAQVARSEAALDALPLPTTAPSGTRLSLTPVNVELLSRLRKGAAAGPTDQLPPELLKHAGPAMAHLARPRRIWPAHATGGLMTYIYKKHNLSPATHSIRTEEYV